MDKEEAIDIFKKLYFKPNRPLGETIAFMYNNGYIPPEFYYEATLNRIVNSKTIWLDVGCGRNLLPHNLELSKELSKKAKLLYGIDPDENIEENEFVHEKQRTSLEKFETSQYFDLITLRMVPEHVESPNKFLNKITGLIKPNGLVVIFTVNKYGWVPFLTSITSYNVHLFFQKKLWDLKEEKDSFPTYMRMNTKKKLDRLFNKHDFVPISFEYLEEASIFYKYKIFRPLFWIEIKLQKLLTFCRLNILKNNFLAVYKKGENN